MPTGGAADRLRPRDHRDCLEGSSALSLFLPPGRRPTKGEYAFNGLRGIDGDPVSDLYARRMSDRLQELAAFARATESGSFSRVAREFGVSQPSVSRMIASLEARLVVKLILRTTRQVTPTDAGSAFLQRARQILGDLEDAENAARGMDRLQGILRVAMSGAFGIREVLSTRLGRASRRVSGRSTAVAQGEGFFGLSRCPNPGRS
jgi:DNA-binding MarR family transcriptional regulator